MFSSSTGLRVSDVVRLSWEHVTEDGRIHIKPQKTSRSSRAEIDIPILPILAAEIDKTPPTQETFMLTSGGSRTAKELRNEGRAMV